MSWFKREDGEYSSEAGGPAAENGPDAGTRNVRTEGLWVKCPGCRQPIYKQDLEVNLLVCPKCQHHFKLSARERIDTLLEPGYTLVDAGLRSTDPLNFTDVKSYKQRLRKARHDTGLDDAILNAVGQMGPHEVVLSAMEYAFIGGSMGAVVGETIARAVDRARAARKPLIVVTASGGARMMEGVVSLMQMAKISTALAQLDDDRVPYICVLDRPHHRRRHRQLRHAGRPEYRRAGRADRFRRPTRHRADHPPKTARRFSALRISARKRISRRSRASPRSKGLPDPRPELPQSARRSVTANSLFNLIFLPPGLATNRSNSRLARVRLQNPHTNPVDNAEEVVG